MQSLPQDHNNEAVKGLYNTYAKKLLAYTVKCYTISKDDAWSLIYKSIYKMAEKQQDYHFESEQKKASFLFRIHINFLKNHFRDTKAFEHKYKEVDLKDEHAITEEYNTTAPESLPLKVLQGELDKLEDWQRILLLMRGQEMPYSKIAEFVKKPESQLKVYYARLKKQLHDNVNAQLLLINQTQHA